MFDAKCIRELIDEEKVVVCKAGDALYALDGKQYFS